MAADVLAVRATSVAGREANNEPIWRGPLVPLAFAATAGILLDRFLALPITVTLPLAGAAMAFALACMRRNQTLATIAALCLSAAFVGAAYHHLRRDVYPSDDIGYLATAESQPVLLRGIVHTPPLLIKRGGTEELRTFPAEDGGRFVLEVTAIRQLIDWQTVSGLAQVSVQQPVDHLQVGDEAEIAGRFSAPPPPANPGETDFRSRLRDQRIRAVVSVKDVGEGLRVLRAGSILSPGRFLARVRAWGQGVLCEYLAPEQQGVAIALLLGDGAPMTRDDWDKYARTGIIHVLAISGQHLAVLAVFLGVVLRGSRLRRRDAAIVTALFLLCYTLLVGGRPPVIRCVVMVWAACGCLCVRRPLVPANVFALAWLVVAVLNPMDLFNTGCQLSFLAVAVLIWGTKPLQETEKDPVGELIDAERPFAIQVLRTFGRHVWVIYAATLAVWVVVAPLLAARNNVLSPVALIIGPPAVLLASVALLSGFALLLLAILCPPLAHVAAWVTQSSLAACDSLAQWSAEWPGAYWYIPTIPDWWLWVYYSSVLALLMLPSLRRIRVGCTLALLLLVAVGLVSGTAQPQTNEFRCTFLSVGHGGCVVMETPNGRTLLYDVGSMNGPEIVRQKVAPLLWHRGITRIDEVFLSHADLDHFNGLVELLERFAVGQVSCTPTFKDRSSKGVGRVLKELTRLGVPARVLSSGIRLKADEVELHVLHPPAVGPEGNENARSMVLWVRHGPHSILLTGDLEGPGLKKLVSAPAPQVDVLMAPHHGNRAATASMIEWANPRAVVSSQSHSRAVPTSGSDENPGPPIFGTWPHGAVTILSMGESLIIETYASKQRRRIQ